MEPGLSLVVDTKGNILILDQGGGQDELTSQYYVCRNFRFIQSNGNSKSPLEKKAPNVGLS